MTTSKKSRQISGFVLGTGEYVRRHEKMHPFFVIKATFLKRILLLKIIYFFRIKDKNLEKAMKVK